MKKGIKAVFFLLMIGLLPLSNVIAQENEDSNGKGINKGPKYGKDSATCVMHLSLYREFFKQKNFKDAYPHWKWVFANGPMSSQNVYIDGVKMVSSRIDECKDPAKRDLLVDTLMQVYDQRITYFGREGYVLGRKGYDLYTYRPEKTEQIYQILKKSVELTGNKSEGSPLVYYFRSIIGMVDLQKLEKSAIVDGYDQISQIIDFNIKENAQNAEKLASWENIKGNIESTFEPYATCPDLVAMYQKKFSESPDDIELLKKITNILERKDCTKEDLFFTATESLHKLQPSAQSAYLMGKLSLQKEQMTKAAEYMQEAANLYEDSADKIKALEVLANINYNQRNFQLARTNALKILQLDPNFGKAYMLIGDLYAASASMCTGDDLGGNTVFWVAVDKYLRARSVDPSVEAEANAKISQYARHFPASGDLFFRDLIEGSSYTVGCWINETTTIRGVK
ncbi:MAG: tetratricopeptide repeat protein [Lentimicrobium sp.]